MIHIYEGALKAIQDYIDYYSQLLDSCETFNHYDHQSWSTKLHSMKLKRKTLLNRMYRQQMSNFRAN